MRRGDVLAQEQNEQARFAKLKGETLDMLGASGCAWLSFEEIADEHERCDGEVDRDELQVALEELLGEGKIEHEERRGQDEYRWRDPNARESMVAKVRRLEAENAALRARVTELQRVQEIDRQHVRDMMREVPANPSYQTAYGRMARQMGTWEP